MLPSFSPLNLTAQPQLLMLLSESACKQNLHSVVDKTMGLGADGPMFKPLARQQLFFPLFASIHLIGRLQGHGTFGLQCSTFFCCQHIPHTSIQLCQPLSLVSWPQNSLKMRPDSASCSQGRGALGLNFDNFPCLLVEEGSF